MPAEDIKNLIEKIQQEGIKAAEDKAGAILEQARLKAEEIIEKAKQQAAKMVAQAKESVAKTQETGKVALTQAGRDIILALRKEITAMLDKLIVSTVHQALVPQELAKILTELIKASKNKEKDDIVISLSKEDLEKIEKGFLDQLQAQIKQGISLRPSDDIVAGFTISYDGGKSHYDFSDKALAEYIGTYLKPKLKDILKDSVRKDSES